MARKPSKISRNSSQSNLLQSILKYIGIIGAILSAILVIGKDSIEFQKMLPDIYYGLSNNNCNKNLSGYSEALRGGNLPLIRCYIENGNSATDLRPINDKFFNHPPLALVAESCNADALEYLIKVAGADPRIGHRYDYRDDKEEGYYDTPKGRCSDTPAMIVETHCHADGMPLNPEGEKAMRLLKSAEMQWDRTGRDLLHTNDTCPWKTGSLKRKSK